MSALASFAWAVAACTNDPPRSQPAPSALELASSVRSSVVSTTNASAQMSAPVAPLQSVRYPLAVQDWRVFTEQLATSCRFVPRREGDDAISPPRQDELTRDALRCEAGSEHFPASIHPCNKEVRGCETQCGAACDSCSTPCINTCETCEGRCGADRDCRVKCAEETAECLNACSAAMVTCSDKGCVALAAACVARRGRGVGR